MRELLGYARVSTADQTLDLQSDALSAAGCSRIWTETASGATTSRPQLDDLFSHLRSGDTRVVWRLDRLGRSLPHLLQVVTDLEERGIGFRSVTESIDTTTTAGGKLVFSIFGALADFERNLIRERTEELAQAEICAQLHLPVVDRMRVRGWGREAECHQRIVTRISELLTELAQGGQASPGMNGVSWWTQ